jgi:DNA-binding CsgD family transcriptional regulator
MEQLNEELNHLLDDFVDHKNLYAENYDFTLSILKDKVNASPRICQITDFEKFAQIYFNPVAVHYFGVNNEELQALGFQFTLQYFHPEQFSSINFYLNHFSSPETMHLPVTQMNYVKSKFGWRWLYNYTRTVSFTKDGKAKYLVTKGIDISTYLEEKSNWSEIKKDEDFIKKNKDKFQLLSLREKVILRLIVAEKTSGEIGLLLGISPLTVDTHRNNIIKKLEVRSSVGFVKYAFMFDFNDASIEINSHE